MEQHNENTSSSQSQKTLPATQGDVLGMLNAPSEGTITEKMGTHSRDFEEWAMRSRLDEEDGLAMLEMRTEDMALEEGYIEYGEVNWMVAAFKTGAGGKVREEMMRTIGAAVNRENQLKTGFFKSITNKGNPNERSND